MARTAAEICKDYLRNKSIRQGVYELTESNLKSCLNELFDVDAQKAREFCLALSTDAASDPTDFFDTGRARSTRA